MSAAPEERLVRCPRCGYDQRGVIASWHETCPLQGVCAECGMDFAWSDLLHSDKSEPRWCIEFVRRRLAWSGVKTATQSCRPWLFWSRLRMSHQIRWRRLALYMALLFLPLLLTYGLLQGGLALYARHLTDRYLALQSQRLPAQLARATARRQELLQRFVPSTAVVQRANAEVARLQAMINAPEHIDASPLQTTLEAIFMPLAGTSSASIVSPTSARGYPAPRNLAAWVGLTLPPYAAPFDNLGDVTILEAGLAWGAAMAVLMPLSFMLVPASLRRAKVRRAHLTRIAVYGLWVPVACICAGAVAFVLAAFVWESSRLMGMAAIAARYAPWLATALWWHAATRRYLKLPQAGLTIIGLTVMNLLVLLALTAALSPRLMLRILDPAHWIA